MMKNRSKRKLHAPAHLARTVALAALGLLVVVFGSLYAAARTFGRVRLSNLADAFDAFSVKDDSAFPYMTDANTVVRMVPIGSGIGVLRTDRLDILTKSGAVLQSVKHTYTMPAVDVRGGRLFLYDRGGTRYQLLSKTKILYTGETQQQILTAALADDGRFAVATTGEGVKSVLHVYKTSGEEFFQYKCVSEYVTDAAFTKDGVALTVSGVQKAAPYSRLLSLHFKKVEPIADFAYHDRMLFHVACDGNDVYACGDTALERLHKNQQQPETAFGSDTLQFLCEEPGGKATLVLLNYGNEHETRLQGLKKNGETAFEINCGEKLKDASRSDAYTCVLTDNTVLTYNNSGEVIGKVTLTQAPQKICLSGKMVYVLFNDHIEPFHAQGEHAQKADA